MAIVKMKKLRVITMARTKIAFLSGLQKLGCVQICEPDVSSLGDEVKKGFDRSSSKLAETKADLNNANAAIGAVNRYSGQKDGMFVKRSVMSGEDFIGYEGFLDAVSMSDDVNRSVARLSDLQAEQNRIESRIASLQPWKSLDLSLDFTGTEHTRAHLAVCPTGVDPAEVRAALEPVAAEFVVVSCDDQLRYNLILCHEADDERMFEILRPFGFSATLFSDMSGTPRQNITELTKRLKEIEEERAQAEAQIASKGPDVGSIKILSDRLLSEASMQSNIEKLMTNGNICFFEGWIPAEKEERVAEYLDAQLCAWETEEPQEFEYPDVPVSLKNNLVTKALNMVTEMYSLPAYGNVDPNPLMAPFFILFYGIMMADMGYGLLMFIAGLVISKKYKPKGMGGSLFNLLVWCGISTFIFGALTGGFFGDFLTQVILLTTGAQFELPSLFTPLGDTLMILIGSMALGFVHIMTGMVISVVLKIRKGEFMDAFWNEITWWVVFAGIALMVLKVTNLVLYIGIALVVAGPVIMGEGMGRITGIFASLYNNVTGYFGDILSYSRLMALMLAGSVIAQVFNTLAAIPGNIIIFIIISMVGNILNFGLNLLGCYVHDLRLQCLEFFGKFYEDGGKPFRPLAYETKYVDIE